MELQDNEIDNIRKGTFQVRIIHSSSTFSFHIQELFPIDFSFINRIAELIQGDIHSYLEEVNFSFNMITTIQTHTFVDLPKLTMINLEDNAINRIERRAFMNMKQLKYINLRGNKITDITDESFQVILVRISLTLFYQYSYFFFFFFFYSKTSRKHLIRNRRIFYIYNSLVIEKTNVDLRVYLFYFHRITFIFL